MSTNTTTPITPADATQNTGDHIRNYPPLHPITLLIDEAAQLAPGLFPDVPVAVNGEQLLTPGEVADLFRVDPKTVTRWAKAGKLPALRTLGGHRRYRATDVNALLALTVAGQVPA